MQAFLSGVRPAIAEPYQLSSLAGHLAFADAGTLDGNTIAAALAQKAADFILPKPIDEAVRFPRKSCSGTAAGPRRRDGPARRNRGGDSPQKRAIRFVIIYEICTSAMRHCRRSATATRKDRSASL
jgi:hypothetical protein